MPIISSTTRRTIRAKNLPLQEPQPVKKLKYSNFLVTINSNYKAKDDDDFERVNDKLAEGIDYIFSNRL